MKTALPTREADRRARIDRLLQGDKRLTTASELDKQIRANRADCDKLVADCEPGDD